MAPLRPLLFLLPLILTQSPQISSQNLSPSQIKTLFRLQRMLEYPPSLSLINNATNFCYLPSSPLLSISCYGTRITELEINGDSSAPLSPSFSADSFFTTLTRLPSLTSLSLVSLGLWGPLSPKIARLSSIRDLNLSSNHLYGEIPAGISSMVNLESLVLSGNSFNGTVPDLRSLANLTELVLKNNSFGGNVPIGFASFDQLQKLDLSMNQFNGKIPPSLFSLPLVRYMDLSRNRFAGVLPAKLLCGDNLEFVDISRNLLMGGLPSCLSSDSSTRVVLKSWNCLNSVGDSRYQHPKSYCSRDPLAAVLPSPEKEEGSKKSKLGLILGILGGIVAGAALLSLMVFLIFKKARPEDVGSVKLPKPITQKTLKTSVQVSPRTPADTNTCNYTLD
ncbi:uncharacterized protein A4U43_C01F23080 [Asparagus officinalis]|uniref:Leucine-rich repeat-containing N-terminal plant-type domain-containing protein n=1 Tax=Asparagus officinalis TaxID=4686 RepID=A0A5P1FRG8_ASPOF|nr:uncharacterized protein A4U43_C01F23080 [Asparagus officinalis]